MARLLPRVLVLLLLCSTWPGSAQAHALSPTARRDLSVLATVYPGLFTAIDVHRTGLVTVVLADGTRVPYDDGRTRTDRQALDDPDLRTMLAQPYPLGPVTAEPALGFSPGRRRVQALFFALYGHNRAEVAANCRRVSFLGQPLDFNRRFGAADAFGRVVTRLQRLLAVHPELRRELLPASGGMVWRTIAGTRRLSVHSFAAAVDVAPRNNPYWRNFPRGTNMLARRQAFPPAIVAAFEAEGFIWGGKWAEFDFMHFEYRPECIVLARLARGENVPLTPIDALVRFVD